MAVAALAGIASAAAGGGTADARTRETAVHVAVRPHQPEPEGFEGWRREAFVDFGRPRAVASGATGIDDVHRVAWMAWSGGMVRFTARDRPRDPFLSDFAEGEDATLLVGATPGSSYRLLLTLGDGRLDRGPLTVWVDGRPAASEVRSRAGEAVDLEIAVPAASDRIRIRLQALDCSAFALCGAAVYVPEGEVRGGLPDLDFDDAPAGAGEAPPSGNPGVRARRVLRAYAEYLVRNRPVEGCFSCRGSWYESSFPVRTLLLAGTLLREPRYREAAFACLDRFVEEQGEDGSWSAKYFGKPDCGLARSMRDSSWARNLADVGCMALCLPLAASRADRSRRVAYLAAARRFADDVVLPNQLESGAFPNLGYQGVIHRHPYSVATGVQAANLSALYAVTGDARYLEAAERAARFLADDIGVGTIRFRPHASSASRKEVPGQLGDLLYMLEGLIWVEHYGSPPVRDVCRAALTRYFEHPRGLASWPDCRTWLGAGGEPWENSKRPGLLFLLVAYGTGPGGDHPLVERWREAMFQALESPGSVPGCEVLSDPDGPQGTYAVAATGFAGLGIAGVIRPGCHFPPCDPRWRRP